MLIGQPDRRRCRHGRLVIAWVRVGVRVGKYGRGSRSSGVKRVRGGALVWGSTPIGCSARRLVLTR